MFYRIENFGSIQFFLCFFLSFFLSNINMLLIIFFILYDYKRLFMISTDDVKRRDYSSSILLLLLLRFDRFLRKREINFLPVIKRARIVPLMPELRPMFHRFPVSFKLSEVCDLAFDEA
jgi:hypothetical protein